MKPCFVIAEAGVNHNGSEKLAFQLIEAAAKSGADAVKFQTFKADALVSKGVSTAEYQKKHTGCDDQYSMLKKLELSDSMHKRLLDHCVENGIEFLSTPFDIQSAKFLVDLGMQRIKIPSGELTNIPFIRQLVAFNKPIILSTGMSSMQEVEEVVSEIREERKKHGFQEPLEKMLVVLHCTSNYPTRYEDVNLNAMNTMATQLNLPVGYSDHTDGVLVPVAATASGATVIEKHFTLDRSLPGPDHKMSLQPDELELMVKQIRQVTTCMGNGLKEPQESELPVRELVRRSVTLVKDKAEGEIIYDDDVALLRPGTGIPPRYIDQVVGRSLRSSLSSGSVLSWQDLEDA